MARIWRLDIVPMAVIIREETLSPIEVRHRAFSRGSLAVTSSVLPGKISTKMLLPAWVFPAQISVLSSITISKNTSLTTTSRQRRNIAARS